MNISVEILPTFMDESSLIDESLNLPTKTAKMKPTPDDSGVGTGGKRHPTTSNSQFKGWRKRHRQVLFSVGSKMADDNNSMAAGNNKPAMMNVTAVAENTHGRSGTTAVPQSSQEKSVVGPLMGVFEDLIKSSTPQVQPLSTSNPMGVKRGSDSDSRPMRSKKSRLNDSDSSTAPKRRKGKTSTDDQRWSKRFTWPDELHREFVSAIFDVGLKHSSPSAIMEFMHPNPNITSERVKSHLQKYRKNRDKSRKEFMTSYENSLQGFKSRSGEDFDDDESEDRGGLTCGEAAAYCTHIVSSERGASSYDSSTSRRSSPVPMTTTSAGTLQLPMLSTEEREGPLGQSFDCLMGLFQSLSQQLEASRGGVIKSAAPSAHVPTSSQYAAQQHSSHQQSIPHSVEQAVVNAASSMHPSSSFNEVANTIPHSLSEPIRVSHQAQTQQGHHQWQGEASRGHQHQPSQHHHSGAHDAHHPQKQAPQYHSHDEIPSIPYSPPRPTHADDQEKPQAHMAAAPQYAHTRPIQHAPAHTNQYHVAPQDQEVTAAPPPPQQSSASTTKAQKESTIMKQEMRGQRAFQNKMRAMMQNEMNKYGGHEPAGGDSSGHLMDHSELQPHLNNEHESPHMTLEADNQFWNVENDDEIFDFLMQS